jgi:hypothetical protein
MAVFHFAQHLCVRSPDRAEHRRLVIEALTQLMVQAIPHAITRWVQFVHKLSRDGKVRHWPRNEMEFG